MKHLALLALNGLALLVAVGAHASPSGKDPLTPGTYCAADELEADFGNGKSEPLGKFLMKLVLQKGSQGYSVSLWNRMPDNPEILSVEAARLRPNRAGVLVFSFTDGWGNRGRGRIFPDGKVGLDLDSSANTSISSSIGRNYGAFRLNRKSCVDPAFRTM